MFLTRKQEKARDFNAVIADLDARVNSGGVTAYGLSPLRQSTVWACVKIISEIIAQLPINIQTRTAAGEPWVTSNDHEIYEVLADPNDFQNQHDLISFLQFWSEFKGNGFLRKVRAGRLFLFPIPASDCSINVGSGFNIRYSVGNEHINGDFNSDEVFHLRNFGSDGIEGLSTIGNHRRGISLAMQLEEHAHEAYKNGLMSNKWIEIPNLPKDRRQKEELEEKIKSYSGAENTGKTPVAANGMKFHEFSSMSAVDAQYIESRKMQKQDIASVFGVPLFLLNDTEKSTTWGTGLEQISRSFIRFSLRPRLNRLSQTFNREFIPSRKRRNTRFIFDTDQFTLGDFKDRMEGYRAGIESGTINADEAREMEGRPPRPGGDQYRMPLNTSIEGEEKPSEDNEEDNQAV